MPKTLLQKQLKPAVNVVGIAFFCAATFLLFTDIFKGFWDHDSGYYFLQSALISQGFKPFIDFTTIYPPVFSALNAIPVWLGADRLFLTWFIPLFWNVAIGFLTLLYWRASSPLSRPVVGWIVAGLFPLFCIDFGGNHNTLELGVAFFGMLALLASTREGERYFFLVGACVGLAFLSKQVGVLLLLPFLTQCRTLKSAAALLAGCGIAIFACLAWLEFDFNKILASHTLLRDYVSNGAPPGLSDMFERAYWLLVAELHRTPPGVSFFVYVFTLAGISLATVGRTGDRRRMMWIASWSMVGLTYLGARLVNNFPHYTLNCWPALVALLAASIPLVSQSTQKRLLAQCAVGAVAVLVLFYVNIRDIQGRPYFSRWSGQGKLVSLLKPVSEDIKKIVPKNATVTQLGQEESILLFLSNRVPLNKNYVNVPIDGDVIIFTDYGQSTSGSEMKKIIEAGYSVTRQWQSPWGNITIYAR